MADADFTVGLKDGVSGPAKSASSAMKRLANDMVAATRAARKSNTVFNRFGAAMLKMKRDTRVTTRGFRQMTREQVRASNQWNRSIKRAEAARERQIRQQRALNRTAKGGGGMMGQVFAANLLAGATAAAGRAVLDGAVAFGKLTIKSAAFLESSRMAFRMLLGDAKAGENAMNFVRKASVKYGLDVFETTASMKKLLAAQFKLGEAKDIIKMGADMKALGASGMEVQSVIRAITQIKGKGRLQMEELNQQLAETGLSSQLVFEELGKALGKSRKEILKMISAGEISADQGVAAIKEAVKRKLGIKRLGDAADATADTLSGMWDRFKAKGLEAMLKIGEKAFPELKEAGKAALKTIAEFLVSPAFEDFGTRLGEGISKLVDIGIPKLEAAGKGFESFFNNFDRTEGRLSPATEALREFNKAIGDADASAEGATGLGAILGELAGAAAIFDQVTTALGNLGVGVASIMGPLWGVFEAIGNLLDAELWNQAIAEMQAAWDGVMEWFSGLSEQISAQDYSGAAASIGTSIVSGIVSGLVGGPIIAKITSLAQSAISSALDTIGAGSPSKVFEEIGGFMGQGMTIGIQAETPAVSAAAAQLIRPAMPPTTAANTTNLGGVSAPVNIAVEAAQDPEATAEAIRKMMVTELADVFEQVSIEVGAA